MQHQPRRTILATALVAVGLGAAVGWAAARGVDGPVVLLQAGTTVVGQPIAYPAGKPVITGTIVTMEPGQSTGWHRHDVPLFGYMLEGELTVDYGPHGTRRYVAGEALLEAVATAHNGANTGSTTARVLVVAVGADGLANSRPAPAPE